MQLTVILFVRIYFIIVDNESRELIVFWFHHCSRAQRGFFFMSFLCSEFTSRKHAFIMLTPLNPTFI